MDTSGITDFMAQIEQAEANGAPGWLLAALRLVAEHHDAFPPIELNARELADYVYPH